MMISMNEYGKKIHQQSPLIEKQTKCARLKAMASEIVSFFFQWIAV